MTEQKDWNPLESMEGELIGAMLVGFAKHEEFDTELCEQFVLLVKMMWNNL